MSLNQSITIKNTSISLKDIVKGIHICGTSKFVKTHKHRINFSLFFVLVCDHATAVKFYLFQGFTHLRTGMGEKLSKSIPV